MNKKIANKIKALQQQAKKLPQKDVAVTLSSGGQSSLARVIKTKEQADTFMKMLNAL